MNVNISGGQLIGLLAVLGTILIAFWIAFLVHRSTEGESVKFPKFPRIIPWTIASRIRHTKAEVELSAVRADLFEAKHAELQKELVYTDLEAEQYKRALYPGNTE